jgi:hypothetical protein
MTLPMSSILTKQYKDCVGDNFWISEWIMGGNLNTSAVKPCFKIMFMFVTHGSSTSALNFKQ